MTRAHFVGIGGIGMSALARYFRSQHLAVSGSDESESPLLSELKDEGITVYGSHQADNVGSDVAQLIYSEAIPRDNPEREQARALGIPEKSYFAALGEISRHYSTIAISGTHGKSTTTAMAGLALEAAGLDPLVILGTKVFEWQKKNIRLPLAGGVPGLDRPRYFAVESCEYHNSFHHLHPRVIIVTNCEPDHLDFFETADNYYAAFRKFAAKLPPTGVLITDFSAPGVAELFADVKARKVDAHDFLLQVPTLALPGQHNRQNAALVLALFDTLGLDIEQAKASLKKFHGTWRRFEKKGETRGVQVFDDYAHHPTEILATLAAFREKFPEHRLWAVFQPHQYSRTAQFLEEFAASFKNADEVLIPNIYRVRDRESDVSAVSADMLVRKIRQHGKHARHSHNFPETVELLNKETVAGDIVITIGAGPVYLVGEEFLGMQTAKAQVKHG